MGRSAPLKLGGSLSGENVVSGGDVIFSGSSGGWRLLVDDWDPDDLGLSPSWTTDCLFLSRSSPSSSSAISFNLRRRNEPLDDEEDPETACSEQAAESFESLRSWAVEISKVAS